MVAGLGKNLFGTAGKIVRGVAATGMGGPILDSFRTARFIVQLAVNVKTPADRWVLWYKFRSSLERFKKARSSLTSTIQGFLITRGSRSRFTRSRTR